jgi:hypothetical protein
MFQKLELFLSSGEKRERHLLDLGSVTEIAPHNGSRGAFPLFSLEDVNVMLFQNTECWTNFRNCNPERRVPFTLMASAGGTETGICCTALNLLKQVIYKRKPLCMAGTSTPS